MADDVLTRNSADELALRVAQSSGDTGTNKDDVYTRDSQGRLAVRTVGGGGADYSTEIEALNNAVSVLETSAELSTEIGGKTTVALDDLTAMDIDGRPSYKQAGATVYAENGVVGIIDSVDSTNAVITTVSTSASVEKGYTWSKSQVIGVGNTACLFLNFGELADGNYEFLIKNPAGVSTTAWGVRFQIMEGQVVYWDTVSFYFPLPQLASGAISKYAAQNFLNLPIKLGVSENNCLFVGYAGYPNKVPGSVSGGYGKTFEFTDLLNLDTGEYIPVAENSVFYNYDYPADVPTSLFGVSPYRTEVSIPNFITSTPWLLVDYNNPNDFQALQLNLVGTDFDVDATNYFMDATGYRAKNRIYMIDIETQDVCLLELDVCVGSISAKVIKATGVFAGVDWKVMWYNTDGSGWYLSTYLIYADGYSFNKTVFSMAFYGSTGDSTLSDIYVVTYATKPDWENEISFTKEKAPTADSSAYTLCHDNGLIEMGGVVPITDTMQPNVAFGNIPVVFPNELANANFVPTITVMTDGTFKQVMADVANPTVTGFDLCVRNVDTEAVSNIKIAWKVVGTKK